MATWSASQLGTAVLERLTILAAGQTAAAEDLKIITDAWASIYPQLRRSGIALWPSTAIAEEFQEPLAKYVAGKVYSHWGFTGPREQTILREASIGWNELQEQAGTDRTYTSIRPDYF